VHKANPFATAGPENCVKKASYIPKCSWFLYKLFIMCTPL